MQSGDGSLSGRGDRKRRLVGYFLLSVLSLYLLFRPRLESDTGWLVFEAAKELACLQRGQYTHCADVASQFPLFQMAPAMLLTWLGVSATAISRCFAYFSLFCFAGSIWLLHHVLKRESLWLSRLGLLIYVGGFGICYSHSSFTEMAASSLALALVACVLLGKSPWLTASVLCIAALTKETSAPLLLLLALLATLLRHQNEPFISLRLLARRLAIPALGAAIAIALNIGLNYFKFGEPFNLKYFQPFFFVTETRRQISFLFGQWFSPSSGLWLSWTSFALLFPVIAWQLFKKPANPALSGDRRHWLTFAGVCLLMLILTAGFSKWFSPFGWIAWGHRLMLPWLPAALLLLLKGYARELHPAVSWLALRPRLAGVVASILALSVFANFRVLVQRSLASQILDVPPCREGAFIESNPAQYYRCVDQLMWPWPEGWPLLKVYSPLTAEPHAFVLAAIYCAGWLWFAKKTLTESTRVPLA